MDKMKRKKWTEEEEETLINKYSEMVASGALAKLRTREKKFLPICVHVNSIHHARDPQTFPWEWTWRDISIKIQNMRHQYMGVKQKIRKRKKKRKKDDGGGVDGDDEGDNVDEYDWEDGVNHWQNFLRYKEVFGDVDLGEKSDYLNEDSDVLTLGWYGDGLDGGNELMGDESNREDGADHLRLRRKKWKKDSGWRARLFSLLCTHLLEIRDLMVKREERERERERVSDGGSGGREHELECEDRESQWEQRAVERELRVERELEQERQRRMRMEEKREREEMEWRERMVSLQMEHEKQMMQMHADACQNQMQILGVLVRLMYQSDGLGGLNPMPSQVLQAMHHPEGMVSAEEKPEVHSAADFIVDD